MLNIFTSTSAGSADMGVSGPSSCISGVSSDTGIRQRRFLLLLARPGEFVSKLRRWRTRPLLGPAARTEGERLRVTQVETISSIAKAECLKAGRP